MSWIKDNQFTVVLGGITAVGAIALLAFGMQGRSKYAQALETYQMASDDAMRFERSPLYPTLENAQAKHKALTDYRASVETLSAAFAPFRPESAASISPQEFQSRLIEARAAAESAMSAGGVELPDQFFFGFESYTTTLPRSGATAALTYQLEALQEAMVALAEARPTELRNFHRPRLAEEDGNSWDAGDAVARPFSFEVTMRGSEAAAREFVSSLLASDNYFYVVRTMRVANERQTPPVAADVRFEPAGGAAGAGQPTPVDPFGGGFVLPGDDFGMEEEDSEQAGLLPPLDGGGGSERILTQVLGNEEVNVFLRIDVLQFLPEAELPTVPQVP